MKVLSCILFYLISYNVCFGQKAETINYNNLQHNFILIINYADASVNSYSSFHSLLQKESYRSRVSSLNNPVSNDLGFSLETEVQTALKPLLAKAKSTNPSKFTEVVGSLLQVQKTVTGSKGASFFSFGSAPAFNTLVSLVGNLAINEKRITKADLDSFIHNIQKYFVQYDKLNRVNAQFETDITRLQKDLTSLDFDLREFLLDMVVLLHPKTLRSSLKTTSAEELMLRYLDAGKWSAAKDSLPAPPADAVKTAKELTYGLQKLFEDYKKVYAYNYESIKGVLNEVRALGNRVNVAQVDASLKELQSLYIESKAADALSLRLATLQERLAALVAAETKQKP